MRVNKTELHDSRTETQKTPRSQKPFTSKSRFFSLRLLSINLPAPWSLPADRSDRQPPQMLGHGIYRHKPAPQSSYSKHYSAHYMQAADPGAAADAPAQSSSIAP